MATEGSGNHGDAAAESVARGIAQGLEAAWNTADGPAFAAPFVRAAHDPAYVGRRDRRVTTQRRVK
jgi:hypothetical protein